MLFRKNGANPFISDRQDQKERIKRQSLSYFGSRYYSSDLSVWLSVYPMSDKYPNESPYVYCGNAPILLKDPNGREKINAFGKHNKTHSDASNRYKDNVPVIHLWAHGNNKMMQTFNPKTDEPQFVRNADDMHAFLCEHSDIYQSNSDNNKTSILVLHSCQTGKGENNIAQQLSSELDLLVVAPSEDYTKYPNGEKNRYEMELPYVLILANRYNNPQACYSIYDLITEMYDAYKIEMDSATINFVLYYLNKGADLGSGECLKRLYEFYIEGKYVMKDVEKANLYRRRYEKLFTCPMYPKWHKYYGDF